MQNINDQFQNNTSENMEMMYKMFVDEAKLQDQIYLETGVDYEEFE